MQYIGLLLGILGIILAVLFGYDSRRIDGNVSLHLVRLSGQTKSGGGIITGVVNATDQKLKVRTFILSHYSCRTAQGSEEDVRRLKSQYPDTLGEDTIIKEYNYEIENSDDIFRLSKEPVCPVWYADGIESNSYIHACHEVEGLFFGLDRYIMTDVFYIDLDDTYKSYSYEDRKSIIAGRILADGDVVERLSSQRKTRYLMDRTTNCREVIADQVSGLNSSFAISKKVVSCAPGATSCN